MLDLFYHLRVQLDYKLLVSGRHPLDALQNHLTTTSSEIFANDFDIVMFINAKLEEARVVDPFRTKCLELVNSEGGM